MDAPGLDHAAPDDRDARDLRWSRLMAAAQAGDRRAYDKLLRECLPLLRQICRGRLRDATEAEDAVQDTLLTIHRARASYDASRPFRPWLVAITERRALDRIRARGRRSGRESALELAADLPAPTGSADAALDAERAAAKLRDAVQGLPESQRTALGLTKLQDLTLQEASVRSGMSIGAIKVATHRAVQTLRRRLTGKE
ncbi:MAG: RNA polymerase sigma factor [Alphaproteobacteria bacterium]|nr:RNA polymerase sigma factor [Alphaproteobacteria bacterium]